jgi:hypothetical protein
MPVDTINKELRKYLGHYEIIADCLAGQVAIKRKREKYLPRPNSDDVSAENISRYNAYLDRAIFYNATRRTLGGLVGQVFSRAPIIKVPDELKMMVDDATGLAVNLVQAAKSACGDVLAKGRAGLYIDYPRTDGIATVADIQSGKIRPTIKLYQPEKIINWRIDIINFKPTLSMVVLEEEYTSADDGYEQTLAKQWRVLQLTAFGYTVQIYRDLGGKKALVDMVTPTNAKGELFDELPFTFIGSENNDPTIDDPPLYDLAVLNVGHFRNSADYEESVFITGQPTPYFTGLTENWVNNVFKGKVQLGSRAAVPLPAGATAGLLQVNPNSLPHEAMQHKERLMAALGAKLVEQRQVQRTATETGIETKDETSILSTTADNVSDAFEFALSVGGEFLGVDTTGIEFDLNTEFDLIKLTALERQQVIAEWIAQAISWDEMRANLRRAGIAVQDDEEAIAAIKANPPPKLVVPGLPAIKPNAPPANPNDPNNMNPDNTN